MARLTEYNPQICEEICDRIADGENIIAILESVQEYPSWSTFRRWKKDNEELQTLYVSSQQDKAISIENKIDFYMDKLANETIESSSANVLIQTLKWKMAKFYPKVFSDKVDVTSGGDKIQSAPTAINIGIVKPLED